METQRQKHSSGNDKSRKGANHRACLDRHRRDGDNGFHHRWSRRWAGVEAGHRGFGCDKVFGRNRRRRI